MYRTRRKSPLCFVFTAWELLSWTLVLSRGVCVEAGWLIKMGGLSLVGALEDIWKPGSAKIVLIYTLCCDIIREPNAAKN
jgi:hypothetical protein